MPEGIEPLIRVQIRDSFDDCRDCPGMKMYRLGLEQKVLLGKITLEQALTVYGQDVAICQFELSMDVSEKYRCGIGLGNAIRRKREIDEEFTQEFKDLLKDFEKPED